MSSPNLSAASPTAAPASPMAQPAGLVGKLNLGILRAENLYNPTWGKEGSQDPWCKVTIGKHHINTNVINNTPSPQWNFQNTIDLTGKDQLALIEVFHKGLIGSSLIGCAEVPLQELVFKQGPAWYRLSKKKHSHKKDHPQEPVTDDLYAGDILIQAQLPGASPMMGQQPLAAQQVGFAQPQFAALPTVSAIPAAAAGLSVASLGEPKVYYGEPSMMSFNRAEYYSTGFDKGANVNFGAQQQFGKEYSAIGTTTVPMASNYACCTTGELSKGVQVEYGNQGDLFNKAAVPAAAAVGGAALASGVEGQARAPVPPAKQPAVMAAAAPTGRGECTGCEHNIASPHVATAQAALASSPSNYCAPHFVA